MRSEGVELIYWADTESGLMEIYNFPGVIYAIEVGRHDEGLARKDCELPRAAGRRARVVCENVVDERARDGAQREQRAGVHGRV